MELTRAIAISVIAASLGLGAAAQAQSLKNVDTPSEFPPASYTANQYVDSKGCVYIRAGIDAATTWVPRMTRSRKVVCGFKPSLANAAPSPASAARLDKNVVVIQPAAAPTSTAAPAPAPKATVRRATPSPAPKRLPKSVAAAPVIAPAVSETARSRSQAKPQLTPQAKPQAKPQATPAQKPKTAGLRRSLDQSPRQSGFQAPCRGALVQSAKHTVRCGPQNQLPYTPGTGNPTAAPPKIIYNRQGAALGPARPLPGSIVRQGEVAADVRVVPRHVYEARLLANDAAKVPEGYRRVFDDGRLNPHRAEQTFAGKASMDAVWQEKLPRRLNPTKGQAAVVSSRSGGSEKALRLSGQSYVQVQTYSDAAAAQQAARQLRGMGLPAKIGKYARGGQTYRMVLAGPFGSEQQANNAAASLHRKGYGQAFVRN